MSEEKNDITIYKWVPKIINYMVGNLKKVHIVYPQALPISVVIFQLLYFSKLKSSCLTHREVIVVLLMLYITGEVVQSQGGVRKVC